MAYQVMEPFDKVTRGDAELCALTANINRDSKRKPDPYVPADFMPHVERSTPEPEEFDPDKFSAAFIAATQPTRG